MNTMLLLLVIIILLHYLAEQVLSLLNLKRMLPVLPGHLSSFYDQDAYSKSQSYTKAHTRLDMLASLSSVLITLALFLTGFFGWLDGLLREVTQHPVLLSVLFFGVLGLLADLAGLPFQWYGQFVIEKRFDFNRMTQRLFVSDKLKSWLLGALIGGPLLALVVWVYLKTGQNFWWISLGLIMLFGLFFTFFYSTLIVPLFNKQSPLEEGPLREAIERFASQAGFKLKNIYTIDGSKRSTKANAYFTGFGKRKRIVLYDTLIQDLSEEEIVAVLAHEIGHYRKKHIWVGMLSSFATTGLMLWLLSMLIDHPATAEATGAGQSSFHIGALVFAVLYSPVSWVTGVLQNLLSRRNEYAADRYAKEAGLGASLKSGLVRLGRKNLSNLTPHPAYVFVYYSHPGLIQRIKALESSNEEQDR